MSGFGAGNKVSISSNDDASVDGFQRWRVSSPTNVFESILEYNDQPLFWETQLVGGATTNHLSDESSLELTTGTASGDSVIRQTYQYFRYQPGKSQLIFLTGVMGAGKANVTKRMGYLDGYDGLFFEQVDTTLQVVCRNSQIDNIVTQDNWDDPMDGSGKSGVILDITKAQIFVIDFQWLGVGRVRFGFSINGAVVYCHELQNSNNSDQTYITTPNLPIRYEIENTDVADSSTTMKQICSSVISEGGFEADKGFDRTVNNGVTAVTITAKKSVLTIRPKNLINGKKNRGNIIPLEIDVFSISSPILFEVIYKGSLGGTPSWASAGDNSIVEYSTNSETVTGGEVIHSGYVPTGAGTSKGSLGSSVFRLKISLNSNIDGDAQDELSIVCTKQGAGSDPEVLATLDFKERF